MIFCRNSSLVPVDRVDIWTQGLYCGFDIDFLILNNLMRILLKQEKIPTTTIDEYGVESEKV